LHQLRLGQAPEHDGAKLYYRSRIAMSSIPGSAITKAEGAITIDAEWLASRLGLSAASLKSEMRKGIVYSVVEAGLSEDLAHTRLPFRDRSRAWTVVVDPDGN